MPFALTTLEAVKRKLDFPVTDHSIDLALQPVLEGVEDYLCERLNYTFSQTEPVDVLERVQRNRKYHLSKRPIARDVPPRFEGKQLGGSEWTTLTGEVIDYEKGVVVIDPTGSEWPPPPETYPRIRHQQAGDWTWDLVRVTYVAGVEKVGGDQPKPADVPPRLQDLAAALAAYFFEQDRSANKRSSTAGRLSESYRDDDIPPWAQGRLASLERGQETAWVA